MGTVGTAATRRPIGQEDPPNSRLASPHRLIASQRLTPLTLLTKMRRVRHRRARPGKDHRVDANRFDDVARVFATGVMRRTILHALTPALLASLPAVTRSKKDKNKNTKRKKSKNNAFGCLNVGQKCRGKNSKCCSGTCQGKKPKKGKNDKSRCVGHDATTCIACTTSTGQVGRCATTTGNAAFCRAFGASICTACKKDGDCQALCGSRAACIPCTNCPEGTGCVGTDKASFSCLALGD
jgi:hypothetical protein